MLSDITMKPVIIGIGGAHSNAGKTTCASLLLENLDGWGAIKYSKTDLYSSITDDPDILGEDNKDTKRFLDAGALRVLWVKSPVNELKDVLPMAVERLSALSGIIVEGNSAIEFLRPDIIIFIFGRQPERLKKGAKDILSKADAVVSEYLSRAEKNPGFPPGAGLFGKSPEDDVKLVSYIKGMIDIKKKISSMIKNSSADGKITCPLARKIAKEANVPLKEVGRAADKLGIKITDCELGCF